MVKKFYIFSCAALVACLCFFAQDAGATARQSDATALAPGASAGAPIRLAAQRDTVKKRKGAKIKAKKAKRKAKKKARKPARVKKAKKKARKPVRVRKAKKKATKPIRVRKAKKKATKPIRVKRRGLARTKTIDRSRPKKKDATIVIRGKDITVKGEKPKVIKKTKAHPVTPSGRAKERYEFPGYYDKEYGDTALDKEPGLPGVTIYMDHPFPTDGGTAGIGKFKSPPPSSSGIVDDYIPQPERAKDQPFLMPIEDVFSISRQGTGFYAGAAANAARPIDEPDQHWAQDVVDFFTYGPQWNDSGINDVGNPAHREAKDAGHKSENIAEPQVQSITISNNTDGSAAKPHGSSQAPATLKTNTQPTPQLAFPGILIGMTPTTDHRADHPPSPPSHIDHWFHPIDGTVYLPRYRLEDSIPMHHF